MNKNVIITNIQKIITNVEQTIEDFSSIMSKEDSYSKGKIEKSINILKIKIENEDNYKINSNEYINLNLLIKKLQSEKISLKKIISDTEFEIYCLNLEIEQKTSIKSKVQRDYEILADSLNISENDEEIYKIMKEKENNLKNINSSINVLLMEIEDKKKNIERYNEEIKMVDIKEQSYRKDLENIESYTIDEESKSKDINQYNILNKMFNAISSIEQLKDIVTSLQQLIEYLGKREADIEYVNEQILNVKSYIAKTNGTILEYLAVINMEHLYKEKEILISKLKDNNLLNEKERDNRQSEIKGMEFEISYYQSECTNDELNLIDYTHRIEKIEGDINKINFENKMLQSEIEQLNLKKIYFMNENSSSEKDEISKSIKRKQKKIENNKKDVEKLIKNKTDIENIIKSIKKSRKNSETRKNDIELVLRETKEFNNEIVNKNDLSDHKKQILMIDIIIEFTKIADRFIRQNYLKILDEISVESLEPFIGVIGFYKYDKPSQLLDEQFMEKVKDSMATMIKCGSIGTQNDNFIRHLNLQGIKVIKFGKALKAMEETQIESEKLVKIGEYHE